MADARRTAEQLAAEHDLVHDLPVARCDACKLEMQDQDRRLAQAGLEYPKPQAMADVLNGKPPEWVVTGLMTVGVYGLAGPPEAGKSLLARDWLRAVSSGEGWHAYQAPRKRGVTSVISEGHHDLGERFDGIDVSKVTIFTDPVMLTDEAAVDDFIGHHEGTDTGLVTFDIVYDMGMADDNGTKDVGPVITSSRRISKALECAVLLLGHPGHNTGRRFRGSSMWRGRFDGEFHMAGGQLTCEKHKYADKLAMRWAYEISWPRIRYLDAGAEMSRESRMYRLRDEIRLHPEESDNSLAIRLAKELRCSEMTIRRDVALLRKSARG